METASRTAIEAENKPDYSIQVDEGTRCTNDNTMCTHEDQDSIGGIFFPAVSHLVVFFPCNLRRQGEERLRAVIDSGVLVVFFPCNL
jgi:hypothetical protein